VTLKKSPLSPRMCAISVLWPSPLNGQSSGRTSHGAGYKQRI